MVFGPLQQLSCTGQLGRTCNRVVCCDFDGWNTLKTRVLGNTLRHVWFGEHSEIELCWEALLDSVVEAVFCLPYCQQDRTPNTAPCLEMCQINTKTNTIEWHKPEPTNITSIRKHSHFWYTLPRLLTPAPSLLLTCHCTSNNVPTDAQECGMHNDNSVHSWSLGALW